jgi:putative glutamine amidotransferase
MNKRPIILISHSDTQSRFMLFCLRLSVWLAGGKPVLISPTNQTHGPYHGLLLAGGVDVDPHRYNETRKAPYRYDFERDALEWSLLQDAIAHQLPVLGICRGMQLMNVFHEGSLYLDLTEANEEAQYPHHFWGYAFYRKKMFVEKGSMLAGILKTRRTRINSLHKQAVNLLGRGLKITAWDFHEIVQCVEHETLSFHLGVQFHPEFLIYRVKMWRLFRRFVVCASNCIHADQKY